MQVHRLLPRNIHQALHLESVLELVSALLEAQSALSLAWLLSAFTDEDDGKPDPKK
jgi:hypothetical protein